MKAPTKDPDTLSIIPAMVKHQKCIIRSSPRVRVTSNLRTKVLLQRGVDLVNGPREGEHIIGAAIFSGAIRCLDDGLSNHGLRDRIDRRPSPHAIGTNRALDLSAAMVVFSRFINFLLVRS
ncbi:hypothetical protein EUGRSUZ_C02213 [Eucalyptus grandis]|uniref:Uncharacterized protein n=2 Tax=Eucalyptus grandis TaxID=71139 RepID=A0ACC3LEX6_EUCGR|nr:hypothetical protein EUGRSUZ_C02213 [Eucalyptus grandis]